MAGKTGSGRGKKSSKNIPTPLPSGDTVREASEADPFQSLYIGFLSGRVQMGFTRVSLSRVPAGVIPGQAKVETALAHVRAGARPPLHLYPMTPESFGVAPDDVPLLGAYRRAGLTKAPAALLAPSVELLEEACLTVTTVAAPDGAAEIFRDPLVPAQTRIRTLFGGPRDLNVWRESFDILLQALHTGLSRLRAFNKEGQPDWRHRHHQQAGSSLARAARTLGAAADACEQGLLDQALILIRALYESALSFYLHWLAPEKLSEHFIAADQPREDWQRAQDELSARRLSAEWPREVVSALHASAQTGRAQVEDVRLRAALSPFRRFHAKLHHRLALQPDFGGAPEFAGALDGDAPPATLRGDAHDENFRFILQCADLAVATIYSCVTADTGEASERAVV